jgi:hypothetical protein
MPNFVSNFPVRGDTTVQYSGSGLAVGDVVQIYDNAKGNGFGFKNYTQMAVVVSTSGSSLTLDMPLGVPFTGDPKIRRVSMLRNVGVERLSIVRSQAASDAGARNLTLNYVRDGFVQDVESVNLERDGIGLYTTLDTLVRSSRAHDAFDYGVGGQAYGIHVSGGTTRCNIVDNKVWNMRHHIIVDTGSNHCVIAYNSTEPSYNVETGDLSHHGFSPHNNLWEGNMGLYLKWDARSETGASEYQGLYNVAYRNRLLGTSNQVLLEAPYYSGNFQNTSPSIIGNVTTAINVAASVIDPFVGANRINGTIVWGAASSAWVYPPSLYTSTKPSFLGSKPWPLFGPSVGSDFGATNTLPAYDRSRGAAAGFITDNGDANYADSGNWTDGIAGAGYGGIYKQDGNTGAGRWATFRSPSKPAGIYTVSVYWIAYSNRATNATIRIYHANGGSTNASGKYDDFLVNMQSGSTSGQFNQVGGNFTMSPSDYVGIFNTGANGYVIADAVKFVPN